MLFNRRQGMRFIAGLHEFWYRATNGLIGGNLFGARVLLLTTTGRKSGKRYTTPLTYLEDGENLVIIASNNGADTDPDWWRNLRADPQALVQIGPQHKELHAEAAREAERDRLWSAVTSRYPVYRRYAEGTKREIPVVVLRAVAAEPIIRVPQAEETSKVDDARRDVEIAHGDPAREVIECKRKLESYLREHGVSFETQHHAVAYTAQEIAAAEHVSGEKVVKVVIVFAGARMVMLALPATRRVDLAKAALAVGAETLRLAKEDEFAAAFPGCDVGAMPPFGNLYGLPVYVDTTLMKDETIVFQAGTHTDTMSVAYADFARLVEPVGIDIAHTVA